VKTTVPDLEEKEILDSYERGEWTPIKNKTAEQIINQIRWLNEFE